MARIQKTELFHTEYVILLAALLSGAAKACLSISSFDPTSMTRPLRKTASWIFAVALMFFTAAPNFAQDARQPLLQDIQVKKEPQAAIPSATPLVRKTGNSVPATNGVRTLFPVLADVAIPGYSGVLI